MLLTQDVLNNFFDDFIVKDLFDWSDRNFAALGTNLPSVNLKETDTKLEVELAELHNSEMWQAGKTVRSLRPENQPGK